MNDSKSKRRKTDLPSNVDRVALSPTEFGAAFGKSRSWAYRMIYDGKIRTIQGLGSVMIPSSELERLTSQASEDYQAQAKLG